jgi:hypothetical protein
MELALVEARREVDEWLESLMFACYREQQLLRVTGDIADAEIDIPYRSFEEAVVMLRKAQEADREAQIAAMPEF